MEWVRGTPELCLLEQALLSHPGAEVLTVGTLEHASKGRGAPAGVRLATPVE